jgi:hypothetical protein
MMLFVKIVLILIIAGNLAVYPNQACAAHYQSCLCCKKTICTCDVNCNGSDQFPKDNGKMRHCSFKCNDCKQKENTQEAFLIAESSSESKKKIELFVGQTTFLNNPFILGATTAASIFEQHLLSSASLFLLNESLRL